MRYFPDKIYLQNLSSKIFAEMLGYTSNYVHKEMRSLIFLFLLRTDSWYLRGSKYIY